jgi:hypothetical protein
MDGPPRKIPLVFYRTPGGAEVVLNWLRALSRVTGTSSGRT